jgi:hypothetical protein
MTPPFVFVTLAKEREKLLKKEKRAKWVSKNREFRPGIKAPLESETSLVTISGVARLHR